MKKIIVLLLYLAESNTHPELSAIVMREGLYVKSAEYRFLPDGHGPEYDDAWLRTLLIACKHELKKNVKDVDLSQEDSDSDQRLLIYLELLLDTFLYRKSENIYSLWKRESDYYCWVLDAVEDLWEEAPNLPLLSENQQKKLIEDIIIASSEDPAVESQFQVFVDHLRKTLSKDSIWVLSESISPKLYKPESHGNHVMANNKILDSSTASPYLSSFDRVSSLTPRRYLFFVCSGIKIPDKDQHGKEIGYINGQKCLNTAKLAFKDYISRVISMLPDLSSDIREPLLELQDGV
ncbi:MAG: hypothetical protein AB2799_19590 [Candidatus Thiodiazotropha sp.]